MYCVIQEVRRKKPDPYGERLEIRAYQNQWRLDESKPYTWAYEYSEERFERPHLEAYKITLHQSYREGGVVRKRQYEIIEAKLGPLRERLEADFHQSAEYQAKQEHQRIVDAHRKARAAFSERYGVDGDEYDRCYDVFGMLRNKEYLAKIKADHKAWKQAEQARWSSYRESWSGTYSGSSSGGYSVPVRSTYTEEETAILKQFYRSLSKTYHPDLNPGKDTTAAMQLLNRLKETWGV